MHFVSYEPTGHVSYDPFERPLAGLIRGDEVVPLGEPMRDLLADGRHSLNEIVEIQLEYERDEDGDLEAKPLRDMLLEAPVPDPLKIICLGLNYRSHAEEAGLEPPDTPTFFAKYHNAIAPPISLLKLPDTSQKVDFEAEVAFVIGRRAKDVDEANALDHVAGFMLFNDLSARDLQFATPQWMPGKVFDGSAPCGPYLVTPDEVDHDAIEFSLSLNGEEMQSASTADLVFGVPEIVARLSALMTLEPGDVIATGTPSGVGSTRDPRVWLKSGDEIVIESPALGRLKTTIA